MAEEKAAAQAAESSPAGGSGSGQKPILFIALAVINMLVVAGVGFMLWKGRQKEAAEPKLDHVIKGEHEALQKEKQSDDKFVGRLAPLETFIVNLAGSKGRKVAKVNIDLEVDGDGVADEISKRKAQIRDIIIIILSSKTYEQVSTAEGKNELKTEIVQTINNFLSKGKIKNVYFTEFIYN